MFFLGCMILVFMCIKQEKRGGGVYVFNFFAPTYYLAIFLPPLHRLGSKRKIYTPLEGRVRFPEKLMSPYKLY